MPTQHEDELPDEPEIARETLFQDMMDSFAESDRKRIKSAFDEGILDRTRLIQNIGVQYGQASGWLYAAKWFADEYDNDLTLDEYEVTIDAPEPFENAQFYRVNFVQIALVALGDAESSRSVWRADYDRAFIVADYPE